MQCKKICVVVRLEVSQLRLSCMYVISNLLQFKPTSSRQPDVPKHNPGTTRYEVLLYAMEVSTHEG